jgi:hypothetical protein
MAHPRGPGELSLHLRLITAGDPPPYEPQVPPEPDERDIDADDIPDTPGSEPPPVPMRDPQPDGAPTGPYIA